MLDGFLRPCARGVAQANFRLMIFMNQGLGNDELKP